MRKYSHPTWGAKGAGSWGGDEGPGGGVCAESRSHPHIPLPLALRHPPCTMAWVINWGGVGSLWGSGISASGAWWLTPGVSGGRGIGVSTKKELDECSLYVTKEPMRTSLVSVPQRLRNP